MSRTLSASPTFVLKFVLAPLWSALAVYALWRLWSDPRGLLTEGLGEAAFAVIRWALVALLISSLVILIAFVVPLKRVRLAPDGLHVSNFRREIHVPFNVLTRVRQNWLPTFRLVTIELRAAGPFGRRIVFMPSGAGPLAVWRPSYWREDAIVGEIRRLAGLTE
jgi:hypothetical protein